MGWNTTDFNWESVSTLYNAPTGLLLNDLLAAATERWNVISDTEISHPGIGDNGPLNIGAYTDVFTSLLFAGGGLNQFLRPVSGSSYDYTNESNISYWDMDELISDIGAIPDHGFVTDPPFGPPTYGYYGNAPLTAEWCQWWYKALNKLVRYDYREGVMATCLRDGKTYDSSDETFAEAKASWAAESWTPSTPGAGFAAQRATQIAGGDYRLTRSRSITDQATGQWKPHRYAGNYTLSAWSKFLTASNDYDNVDYPCSLNTYARLWNDESSHSGVYGTDFEFGYFDTITASEPEDFKSRGWFSSNPRTHCRFDVSGGFEYV